MQAQESIQRITLIVKAVGTFCNLKCRYCFYHGSEQSSARLMNDDVLRKLICEYLDYSPLNVFVWHGGEPLLAGLSFFEKALCLQEKYSRADNKTKNYLQTNATLVDRKWAKFFADNDFKIGVSLDGPKHIHDRNRLKSNGQGSFDATIRGLETLREAGIRPGIISVITKETLPYLAEILDFLHDDLGMRNIAFNAVTDNGCVESSRSALDQEDDLRLLETCFEYWRTKNDIEFAIRDVDELIAGAAGLPTNSCGYSGKCYEFLTVDDVGNVYPCERLPAERAWSYGDISSMSLREILGSQFRLRFLQQQTEEIPVDCLTCEFQDGCHNGCTSFREGLSANHVQGRYTRCANRMRMYQHIRSTFALTLPKMTKLIIQKRVQEQRTTQYSAKCLP